MIRLDYDNALGEADLGQAEDGGVAEGSELATALLISLFTDRRADEGEVPTGADRGGWWGDAYPDEASGSDPIGSRLWTIKRASTDAAPRAREAVLEALAWMVADGIASAVEAEATRTASGRIDLSIVIELPDGTRRTYEVPDVL